LEKIKDGLKKVGEWCKEHWKEIVTVLLVIAAIAVIVVAVFTTIAVPALLVAMAIEALIGAALGGVIGGIFSVITGGSFWEGFKEGAFYGATGGAIGGAMSFVFTGVVWGGVLTLKQLLLIGGVSAIGSVWVGDLGDIVLKGVKMSLKEIVIDVVVAGVTGVVFAGIAYGLSKAFKALKLKIINKGGSKTSGVGNPVEIAGKGSTGRTVPNNINEQMAMHQVQSNPLDNATELPFKLKDERWSASDGWVKMQSIVENSDGTKSTIHFVYNKITGAFDDFKFK